MTARHARLRKRVEYVRRLFTARTRFVRHRAVSTTNYAWRRAAAAADIVSFDVFDTALFRRVIEPADVFEIVAHRLRAKGIISLDPQAFRSARVDAETQARRAAAVRGVEEVTLAEIYDVFARDAAISAECCMSEELAVETAVLIPNADLKRHYDVLAAAGKTIVFLTDTYLPEAFVDGRLRALGFDRNHRVFASSTHRLTKASGRLFAVAARFYGGEPSRIAHLGDNLTADGVAARRQGVNAFWYQPLNVRSLRFADDDSLGERICSRLEWLAGRAHRDDADEHALAALGTGMLGPIFLGLTQWLDERLSAAPADLTLYCSRDGYMLEKLSRLFDVRGSRTTRYFEVSRRSLSVPSIAILDERALDVLCGNNAALPLRQFFSRIGIELSPYANDVRACGLDAEQTIASADDRLRLRRLFERLWKPVTAALASEFPAVAAYCRSAGCFEAQEIALVDIGWGATLQTALANVLRRAGHGPAIHGFYLSTDPRAANLPSGTGSAFGWWCSQGRPAWMQDVVSQGYWMLEIAFAAPTGSVLGYDLASDGVRVLRQPYDAADSASRIGDRLQAHALTFAEDWRAIFDGLGAPISASATFRRYRSAVLEPSRPAARIFGDVLHNGGLGNTRESQYVAKPPPIAEFIRRPFVVRREYFRSHWKRGYLTRLFSDARLAAAFVRSTEAARTMRVRLVRMLHR